MSDVTPKTETPCIETDWWRDEARGGYGRRWIDGKNWRAHREAGTGEDAT